MRSLIIAFCVLLIVSLPAYAMQTSAKQAIIMDYDTGMVLFEKNADTRMPTSSMSKVMTMYLVFEALKQGQIRLDDKFLVSEKAWRKGGSKMFVEVDRQVKVEDLIRGVIIQSGNDAAIVLAEGLSGTEDAFAEALTRKARELGMRASNFKNASGWPDPNHYSTAKDLAILARNLVVNFPEYYGYYSEREFTFNNINQKNRNPLLYRDLGADGIKTGHTQVGGYGLIASGTRDGRRVILVVNGLKTQKARAQESARLLDWGLQGFDNITLFDKGEVVDFAEVAMGKAENVPLVLQQDLRVTVPSLELKEIKANVVYSGPLVAPIRKGDQVAILVVEIPKGQTLKVPMIAGADVAELGMIAKTFSKAKTFLFGADLPESDSP